MTSLNGKYEIEPKSHRLLAPINDICIITNAIYVATHHYAGKDISRTPATTVALECNLFPVEVFLPVIGPVSAAIKEKQPEIIGIEFRAVPKKKPVYEIKSSGFKNAMMAIFTASIVNLYEDNLPFLKTSLGSDTQGWPDFWNFARVIRNACSHGGMLNFLNPNATPVNWHDVSYDPSQNGRQIIGGDFSFGDMIVLLVEISDELDGLGYSI